MNKHEYDKIMINNPEVYYSRGLKAGMEAKFSSQGLKAFLDGIYNEVSNQNTLSIKDNEKIQRKLNERLRRDESEKTKLNAKMMRLQQRISSIDKNIDSYQLTNVSDDLLDYQDQSRHFLTYTLGGLLLILLTLYLFLFYSSTGFSALYGVPKTGSGIFNPGVFSIALSRGGSALTFVVLFPIVFLAVGFSTYISLENGKKENSSYNTISNTRTYGIIAITLIADIIIGYQISKGVYMRDYNVGMYSELWSSGMVFNDANFYFIIVLGFTVYLMWGFLLNYVIGHPYRAISDDNPYRYEQITLLEEERDRLNEQLIDVESRETHINNTLQLNVQHLKGSKAGKIPHEIIMNLCTPLIVEFLKGYQVCIKNANESEVNRKLILEEINRVYRAWKIENQLSNTLKVL